MHELGDALAFEALRELLSGESQQPWCAPAEPSVDRLRLALGDTTPRATSLDLAVLLRQALRREYKRRAYQSSPRVVVKHPRLRDFTRWDLVGMRSEPVPGGWRVTAEAWKPRWLKTPGDLGVDDFAAGESLRRTFHDEGSEGDPFLAVLGRSSYRSVGQRAAVRAALSTPPGATLAIALPTGEGKSMIFQLVHAVGFAGQGNAGPQGVTLVIVPTVALGVNHEEEAVRVCGLTPPLAYQGGAAASNALIAERIARGAHGLFFVSPEAACGALRLPLRQAAEAGRFQALVIDEAHLVDQWGTGFRSDFQELSGLRQELLALSATGPAFRTLLLSATLTDQSQETLRALFGVGGQFDSIAAVRLRPEPDYWVADADDFRRNSRVLEALAHVPRPAVLYVTEVEHAKQWRQQLEDMGYGRVGMVHGKTSREDRESIVSQWRKGQIDIVVGTSAFGLGIDYAHARSVIHACVPETLDRFYQEVGRAGRDGRASLSLIVPTNRDVEISEGINQQKVISVERGLERWEAMFFGKRAAGIGRFAVRVDGSPGTSVDDIDMTGDWNSDWNLRTLALMTRAGLLRLHGRPHSLREQSGDWLEVEILNDEHLQRRTWDVHVQPVRAQAQSAGWRNLQLMVRFLSDRCCPADLLEELYGQDRVARTCASCSRCRSNAELRIPAKKTGEPRASWTLPLPPLLAGLFDADRRLLVTYGNVSGRSQVRRLGDLFERLNRIGLAKMTLLGPAPFDQQRVFRFAQSRPFFVNSVSSLVDSRLPHGPEAVFVAPDQSLGEASYASREGRTRMFFVPEEMRAASGHVLREVFGGRTLTLEDFEMRVSA
jgi:ATP-dependent DNA helicase RecQ